MILATTAVRPSSAILLIPKSEYWSAGSTDLWLNATFQKTFGPSSLYTILQCRAEAILIESLSINGSLVLASCHVFDSSPVDYPLSSVVAVPHTLHSVVSSAFHRLHAGGFHWRSRGFGDEFEPLRSSSSSSAIPAPVISEQLKIFKRPVPVLAMRDEAGDGEHLETGFWTTWDG